MTTSNARYSRAYAIFFTSKIQTVDRDCLVSLRAGPHHDGLDSGNSRHLGWKQNRKKPGPG